MSRLLRHLLLVLVLASAPLAAQDIAARFDPRSGDGWVDAQLADVNAYGARWPGPFADELARYHDAPRGLVEDLMHEGWAPGDIYFACALAQATGQPCRAVTEAWALHRGEGWGALARQLGIPPGSPAFHALKRDLVASYDRWGRPIRLDATLRADFPGRAGAAPASDLPEAPPRQHDAAGRAGHAPPSAPPHGHQHKPGLRPPG